MDRQCIHIYANYIISDLTSAAYLRNAIGKPRVAVGRRSTAANLALTRSDNHRHVEYIQHASPSLGICTNTPALILLVLGLLSLLPEAVGSTRSVSCAAYHHTPTSRHPTISSYTTMNEEANTEVTHLT